MLAGIEWQTNRTLAGVAHRGIEPLRALRWPDRAWSYVAKIPGPQQRQHPLVALRAASLPAWWASRGNGHPRATPGPNLDFASFERIAAVATGCFND